MIVQGASRAEPEQLAEQLHNPGGGKRIEILEMQSAWARGWSAAVALRETLRDWQIVSELTQGRHGLYHAVISPAPGCPMTEAQYRRAVFILTEELGLEGYPRLAVLHDDGTRPYLNVVWQRTNIDTCKLWSDAFNFRKHERASRRMEAEFGHAPVTENHGNAFSRGEERQARRTGVDLAAMKAQITALKDAAESALAFKNAVEDAGYILARGNRAYVLVDAHRGVYGLARQLGMTIAEVKEYMAPVAWQDLPTVNAAKERQPIHQPERKETA